jgi:hypothetical protein
MVFSSILQNDGPKPKKIWVKWGTKHTLNYFPLWPWTAPIRCTCSTTAQVVRSNFLWRKLSSHTPRCTSYFLCSTITNVLRVFEQTNVEAKDVNGHIPWPSPPSPPWTSHRCRPRHAASKIRVFNSSTSAPWMRTLPDRVPRHATPPRGTVWTRAEPDLRRHAIHGPSYVSCSG